MLKDFRDRFRPLTQVVVPQHIRDRAACYLANMQSGYRIDIQKDPQTGEVRYSVTAHTGEVLVPPTVLGKSPVFAHESPEVDVVLLPARGGMGGGPTHPAGPTRCERPDCWHTGEKGCVYPP